MGVQAAPAASHRSHDRVKAGVPDHVPSLAVSVAPSAGVPPTAGRAVAYGASAPSVSAYCAQEPPVFPRFTSTSRLPAGGSVTDTAASEVKPAPEFPA